jgi:hypothetical protein
MLGSGKMTFIAASATPVGIVTIERFACRCSSVRDLKMPPR